MGVVAQPSKSHKDNHVGDNAEEAEENFKENKKEGCLIINATCAPASNVIPLSYRC